jgi:hypothetical protein
MRARVLVPALLALLVSSSAYAAVEIDIDKDTQTMTVSVNDEKVKTMPISMGKPQTPTPAGTYTVMSRHNDYTMDSSTYGVPADSADGYQITVDIAVRMSYSGIFYHSAPWSVGDQGSRNVSHGCINLSTEDARWMMNLSKAGSVNPAYAMWTGNAILLVADTRHDRGVLASVPDLRRQFPIGTRACLRALGTGQDPGRSSERSARTLSFRPAGDRRRLGQRHATAASLDHTYDPMGRQAWIRTSARGSTWPCGGST